MMSKYTRHNNHILDRLALIQEKQNEILREHTFADLWLVANTERRIIKYLSRYKNKNEEAWLPEEMYIQKIQALGSSATWAHYYCTMTYCLYLLGKFKRAIKYAEICIAKDYFCRMMGFIEEPVFYFSYSMSLLSYIKHTLTSARGKYDENRAKKYLEIVESNRKKLKVLSDAAPFNFAQFYKILEAEYAYVLFLTNTLAKDGANFSYFRSGAHIEHILTLFKSAIKQAEAFGLQREIGLAKELLLFVESQLETQLRKESVEMVTTQWGASLETFGDNYLFSTLVGKNKSDAAHNINDTEISQTTQVIEAVMQASKIPTHSANGGNGKHNTAEALLNNFVNIASEVSNANYIVVILATGDDPQLYISAIKNSKPNTSGNESVNTISQIEYNFDSPLIPNEMVQQCWEKGVNFSLAKPADGIMFKNDKYFVENHPANVLCKLLEHKGKPCGVLYIEMKNGEDLGMSVGLDGGRVVVNTINIITAQLLTSLENTWLINELESQSEELMRMNKKLMRQEKQKRAMLETMGHETKTPLNIVFGMTEMLEEGDRLDGNQLKALKTISGNAERLLNLVNEMLRQNSVKEM
eukprot:TRINITY_DN7748_c0_g1_i1.p1 TRINITY_DN7748_c0_g1~~TRINITY_DN7748_c0_g1_i1.p1  ORF type:complete len:584 (-),score=107.05 TRINITY_DN7748_c0_g1_i1:33-1784(-)